MYALNLKYTDTNLLNFDVFHADGYPVNTIMTQQDYKIINKTYFSSFQD
jgi:hypothetical protein